MKKTIQSAIIFFCFCNISFSQILNIPEEFNSIQEAIDSSSHGDTILVANGIYYENINFKGKKITFASNFIIDNNHSNIQKTIINGSKSKHSQYGSVVYFVSGEDTSSVLYGLTITGGTGTHSPPNHKYDAMAGGGILVSKSGAKIIYNRIIENTVLGPRASGGGIMIEAPASPVYIINNYIADNKIEVMLSHGGGAGIFSLNSNSQKVIIAGNIISGNIGMDTDSSKAIGGGIKLIGSNPMINNNLIKYNITSFGGGIGTSYPITSKEAIVENNTFVHNEAKIMGGAIFSFSQKLIIRNCIIWGNHAPTDPQIVSDCQAEYCNIKNGYRGENLIDKDPQFSDSTLYYLRSTSPCVDKGNPDLIYNDLQESKKTGFALFPSQEKLRNDLGAYGGPFSNSFWSRNNAW